MKVKAIAKKAKKRTRSKPKPLWLVRVGCDYEVYSNPTMPTEADIFAARGCLCSFCVSMFEEYVDKALHSREGQEPICFKLVKVEA